jgi:hypothetical protein
MFKKPLLLIILSLFLLTGCLSQSSSQQQEPAWINNLYDNLYPEVDYLCAVGSASDRINAINAAFSSLSQTFNAKVDSLVRSYSESYNLNETYFYDSEALIDQLSVSSQAEVIIGAQVVNSYVDKNNLHWVRIAIDRKKAVTLYLEKMEKYEEEINRIRRVASLASSPLERYFKLLTALQVALKHQNLADQAQVLSGKSQKQLLWQLQSQLDELSSSIALKVEIEQSLDKETEKELKSAFASLLDDWGFSIKEEGTAVLVTYNTYRIDSPNSPYRQIRWSITVIFKEGSLTLATLHKEGRETALNENDALRRALKAALLSVEKEMATAFGGD